MTRLMFFLFYRWITIFLLIIQHLIYFSDSFKWYIDELCTVRISSSCDGVNEKEGSLFLTFPHLCWGGVKNIKNAINLDLWNVCYNLIFGHLRHHPWSEETTIFEVRWSTRKSKTWIFLDSMRFQVRFKVMQVAVESFIAVSIGLCMAYCFYIIRR